MYVENLDSKPLAPGPAGTGRVTRTDKDAFARDLNLLRKEIDASLNASDLAHLRRFAWAARLCSAFGYATGWMAVNPLSALLISTGIFARWTVVMHHVGHGGYDRVPGVPAHLTSRRFAAGWRRVFDWLDWMPPEAWRLEHNMLHHGHTNEEVDPDFVERNAAGIRRELPGLKHLQLAFFACTWKWSYYMPAAMRALRYARARRAGHSSPHDTPEGLRQFYELGSAGWKSQWRELVLSRELWMHGLLPYALVRFAVIPLLFLPLGRAAALHILLTSLLAEVFTNLHGFLVVVPSHAGADLRRFESPAGSRSEFYWRQVVASANYTSPGAWSDFLMGGLNFQIEHHLWPDLPLSSYRLYAARVRALCERHGIPYREDPLWVRVRMLGDVVLGRASLRTSTRE